MASSYPWPPKMRSENEYYDLGSYQRPITTTKPEAQVWFNRGLVWSYAFNHEEAVRCFEKASAIDPECSMAYWGLAYALGPNYNKPWEFFEGEELKSTVDRTHGAVERARTASENATPVERALIDALTFRYPQDKAPEDWSIWNRDYADAIEPVYRRFPDDLDVATLYTDALMNLTPWALWNIRTGEPSPDARTLEAKSILDNAFKNSDAYKHPGLLHLYIHLMEMSGSPESALNIANHLRGLVPDAGHLHHMPTHLDVLCGDYQRAISSNSDAILADEKYLKYTGPLNFYTLYRSHDYHFLVYAAMFAGKFQLALSTAARLEASIPESLLRITSPPMADWLESFLTLRIHVLIRFGRRTDILALPLPTDQTLYCVTTTLTHYAHALASAATSDLPGAHTHQALFAAAAATVPASRTLFNNTATSLIAIADAMLAGEIAYRAGATDEGFAHLRRAIELDDGLPYDEPWGWMQPTRHAYGALLLEQGRLVEAEAVYKADLGRDETLPRALRHPGNVWALCGLAECLERMGRGKEAVEVRKEFEEVQRGADVRVRASCFCRLEVRSGEGEM